MRIIVADDHEVIRKGVCSLLSDQQNIDVCAEASNGQEAIKKALQLSPDLIILDFMMPMMDGVTATKEIKRLLPQIPIILLSVHDGPEVIRLARESGAQGFVTKDCAASTLLDAVDAVLRGETFFGERAS